MELSLLRPDGSVDEIPCRRRFNPLMIQALELSNQRGTGNGADKGGVGRKRERGRKPEEGQV
jgi:hypothetical protein